MITSLAIITLIVQALLILLLVLRVTNRWHGLYTKLVQQIQADALRIAALVGVVAMAGSLYFSEVKNFAPCNLCWYQRIAMYSIAIMLPVAAWKRDFSIALYVKILAVIGAIISIYHIQLERFPDQESATCSISVPCTTIWFQEFGYITIPVMALTAFIAIITLLNIGEKHG